MKAFAPERRAIVEAHRGFARRAASLLLLFALAGCIDEEHEQEFGNALAAEINAQVPLIRDLPLVFFIDRMGQKLVQVSERPELRYRFYIVDSDVVNAFALPGGHIYLSRGLIQRTQNASQLAAVLAHEIGHVAARHGTQALERELRTGSVVNMLYHLFLLRERPLLEHGSLDMGRRLWQARHSRAAEREADQLALQYLMETGTDPEGMIVLLRGLIVEDASEHRPVVEWFSSHPMTINRIRLLERKVARIPPAERTELADDSPLFHAFQRRLSAAARIVAPYE